MVCNICGSISSPSKIPRGLGKSPSFRKVHGLLEEVQSLSSSLEALEKISWENGGQMLGNGGKISENGRFNGKMLGKPRKIVDLKFR